MFLGSTPVEGKLVITNHYEYGGALMLNQFTSFLAIVTLSSTMSAGVVRGAWALCFIVVLLCLAVILL